jgi:hypothetical protein
VARIEVRQADITNAARIEVEQARDHLAEGSGLELLVFAVVGEHARAAFEAAVAASEPG